MRGWMLLCAALSASALMLGCGAGGDAPAVPVYPVTGKVILHGAPLADASVSFAPLAGQPTAVGRTNAQGEFTLSTYDYGDGAAAGEYAVVVSKAIAAKAAAEDEHSADPYATAGEEHDAGGQAEGDAVSVVPPQYGKSSETPLRETVKQGENRFEFKIE